MTIHSMTGFGRGEASAHGHSWVWEVRSVNARGLDIRCRLPSGFEPVEPGVRQKIGQALKRGNVAATLSIVNAGPLATIRINTDVLEQLLSLIPDLQRRLPQSPPPTVEGMLGLRGVLEAMDSTPSAAVRTELQAAVVESICPVIAMLVEQRRGEGERLRQILIGHIDRIGALETRAVALAAAQPEAIHARLSGQVSLLLADQPALPAERIAQEVAILATRADIREELDRIRAHYQAAMTLLAESSPIGRQLDFLCQEFNREANTLCSKSADIELTRVGLELKSVIDQLREQVQNVE